MDRQPDRIPDARYSGKMESRPGRVPGVRHPDEMAAQKDSGCETSGWNGGEEEIRVRGTRIEWQHRRISDGMLAEKDFRV